MMVKKKTSGSDSCQTKGACRSPRPELRDRPLLPYMDAVKVQALFKILANDTRLRLLHHLVRSGEATVTEMAKTLGMKPQAISNQLVRLSDTGMLVSRRDGNKVYYRVENPCVPPLLDLAICLMEDEGAMTRRNHSADGK